MKATWSDVLAGCAHVLIGGTAYRATIPAAFSDDPDVDDNIHVTAYPAPGMPSCHEVAVLTGHANWNRSAASVLGRYMRSIDPAAAPTMDEE